MAADALVATSWWGRVTAFVRDSFHEVRAKTTWPDLPQVRQASIAIIIFVLLIGLVIALLDLVLHTLLIRLLPSLFA
jgi:preprotein translocase SecE subunit